MKRAVKTSGKVKKSAFNRGSHIIKSNFQKAERGNKRPTKYIDPGVAAVIKQNQEEE